MYLFPRTVSIGVLSLLCLLPMSAAAIGPDDVVGGDPVTEPPTPDPEPPTPEPPTPDPEPPTPDPDPPTPPVINKDPSFKGDGKEPVGKEKTPVPPTKVIVPAPPTKTNTYPVHTGVNYCPAGLQPVTISGSISCGKPNKSVTYQQMLKHPQKKKTMRVKKTRQVIRRSAVPTCNPGTKGCSDR